MDLPLNAKIAAVLSISRLTLHDDSKSRLIPIGDGGLYGKK